MPNALIWGLRYRQVRQQYVRVPLVAVTIDFPEADVLYQLRDDDTDAPLSGYFSGTGPNLTINSDALGSDVTIKVSALNPIIPCPSVDLTDVVVRYCGSNADGIRCGGQIDDFCGTTVTLGATPALIGTGAWSFAPGGNPDALALTAFSNTSLATSGFTGTAGQTYILRWTISNGVCTAKH